MVTDSLGGIWLTCHQHQTGKQYAIFYDPIPKFLQNAVFKIRLDTREDWPKLQKVSLTSLVEIFFENK
jgi:hypothetical protein